MLRSNSRNDNDGNYNHNKQLRKLLALWNVV